MNPFVINKKKSQLLMRQMKMLFAKAFTISHLMKSRCNQDGIFFNLKAISCFFHNKNKK